MAITFDIDSVPAHDRDRVASLIPDERLVAAYVHRDFDGLEDFDLFDVAVEEQENVLLAGPTGSSKTTVARAYAAARGLPFAIVESHASMDKDTVIGKTTVDTDGIGWIDGDMTLVVRYGGVLLIDEVNMAHPRIMAGFKALLSITRLMTVPENTEVIRAGRGGIGEPQPFVIFAAYNPRYQGTQRLNEALLNQFAIPLEWGYDHDVESQLLNSGRLLEMAEHTRSLPEIRTPVSTNSLMEFERHCGRVGMAVAQRLFVNRFAPEERAPVARALEANIAAIADELGLGEDEQS